MGEYIPTMEEAEAAYRRGADPVATGEYRTQDVLAADFRAFVESVRADERARLGAATTHTERDMGLSDGHSESYRAGWRMGAAAAREDERERIARNIEAARGDVLSEWWRDGMDRAARIARERNGRG